MRLCFIVLVTAIVTASCSQSNSQTATAEAPSARELCNIFGRDFETDPLCTRDNIRLLLEAEFLSGTATRDEVHKLLSPFLVESHSRPAGGMAETYALQQSLLGPVTAYFSLDANGVLIGVTTGD